MRTRLFVRLLLSAAVAGILAGCGSSVEFVRTDPTVYPAKAKTDPIEVYQGNVVRPHVVIGVLTATEEMQASTGTMSTYDEVLFKLKDKARKVGADALVQVKPVHENEGRIEATVTLTAKAVRYLERSRSVTARQR